MRAVEALPEPSIGSALVAAALTLRLLNERELRRPFCDRRVMAARACAADALEAWAEGDDVRALEEMREARPLIDGFVPVVMP